MTGQTERQYRRRAHYPARINFGVTAELRAALEALADKADTCVAEVARDCIEAARRTKGRRTVNRRPYAVAAPIAVLAGCQERFRAGIPRSMRYKEWRLVINQLVVCKRLRGV